MTPFRLIPAFVLGLLSPQSELPEPARACVSATATATLLAGMVDPAPEGVDPPAAPTGSGIAAPVDKQLTFARLYLARGFGASAGRCDLVIHFHGAPETTIPAFEAAGMRAALLLVNLGVTGEPYVEAFSDGQAFPKLLDATSKALRDNLPDGERCSIERIALSAFSAGYAAIARILNLSENRARVDAVLLADAMHAPFTDRFTRRVDARGMTGITRFGRLATDGERMLSITHSSIETEAFASTTRTASALMVSLGVEPVKLQAAGPRQMTMTYRADSRGLHVKGYTGGDAPAHSDHLRAIGQTLFPELRDRWATR